MKSKMMTKKSIIFIIIAFTVLFFLLIVANKTVVADRLESMKYQQEYGIRDAPDGIHLVEFYKDNKNKKTGKLIGFEGVYYALSESAIPGYVDGVSISGIAQGAYANNDTIEKVILPNTIRFIESNAFNNCLVLKEVYVPASVEKISDDAFDKADSLTMFVEKGSNAERYANRKKIKTKYYISGKPMNMRKENYPETNDQNEIVKGNYTFKKLYYKNKAVCILKSYNPMSTDTIIDIPSKINNLPVIAIGEDCFMGNGEIVSVHLPETVIGIGPRAFGYCPKLKEIHGIEKVYSVSHSAFDDKS